MIHASASAMAEALQRVGRGEILDRAAMSATMDEIMAGACDDRQIAGLLMGMAARGEHLEEIVGAAMAMRRVVHRIVARRQPLLDTCGTGGSGVPRRNVSTAAAIAVAACGVGVAKHGNRGASSPCGSADLLEAVGVDLGLSAEQIGASIDRLGIGFCFAPALHPAMRHAASSRKSLGVRTLFNFLGPLCNPAFATRQLLGVMDPARCRDMAQALGELGSDRVIACHGFFAGVTASEDAPRGIDDASPEGETLVWEWHAGRLSRRVVCPEDAGLPRVAIADLAGGGPQDNAEAFLRLLEGEPGPYRVAVQFAGALALLAASEAPWSELPAFSRGIGQVLDGGQARACLADLIAHDGSSFEAT